MVIMYANTDYRSIVNYEIFDILQDYSGNDFVIEYHLLDPATGYSHDDWDWNGNYYHLKGEWANTLSFSREESEFIRFAFDELSRLTGTSFRESGYQEGILNIFKVKHKYILYRECLYSKVK